MTHQQAKLYNQVNNESEQESDDEDDIDYITGKRSGLIGIMWNPSFILFILSLILSIFSILYYFIGDIDIDFMFCGGISLIIFIFGLYKFRILLGYKNEVIFYQNSIRKLKIQNLKIKGQINRSKEAIKILQDTKNRIKNINLTNKNNINSLEEMEKKMENAGIENNLYNKTVTIRKVWTAEYLKNEQETVHKEDIVIPKKIKSKTSKQKKVRFKSVIEITKYSPCQEFNDLYIAPNNNNNINNDHDGNQHNHDNHSKYDTDNVYDNADDADNGDNDESAILISEATDSSQSRSQSPFIKVQESNDYDEKHDDIDDNEEDEDDAVNGDDNDDDDDEEEEDDDDNKDYDDDDEDKADELFLKEMYNKKGDKMGKLQKKWNMNENESEKETYPPKSPQLKHDGSWIQHSEQSSVHPVHESVDAMEINKLVSQAQIFNICTPDEPKQKRKVGKLKRIKSKQAENELNLNSAKNKVVNEDTSWIKHKKLASIHPVHESVDALSIERLVSQAKIIEELAPVGEDQEDDQ